MSARNSSEAARESASPDKLCAGCGRPIGSEPILKLANDNVVHFGDYACLIAYGRLREIPCAEPRKPVVTEEDALADAVWFKARPERRFRARAIDDGTRSSIWLIRRRPQAGNGPDILLRTFSSATLELLEDADGTIAIAWYRAAYPDWLPEKVREAAAKALKGGVS